MIIENEWEDVNLDHDHLFEAANIAVLPPRQRHNMSVAMFSHDLASLQDKAEHSKIRDDLIEQLWSVYGQ
jgi:hypothetical protein